MCRMMTHDVASGLHIGDQITTITGRWEVTGKDEDKSYPDLPPPVVTLRRLTTGEVKVAGWWPFGQQGFCDEGLELVPELAEARLVVKPKLAGAPA